MLAQRQIKSNSPVVEERIDDSVRFRGNLSKPPREDNKLKVEDRAAHQWYRFVLSFLGQVEIDELYVGLDKKGVHYIFPVQAKGGSDKLNVVQIEQDLAVCANKFSKLICRPIGAQFINGGAIALFEFEEAEGTVRISAERHYRLVPPEEVTKEDLESYRQRIAE